MCWRSLFFLISASDFLYNFHTASIIWGGSRGGSGGLVKPPKLYLKTYNKRVVKKKWTNYITTVVSTKMEVTLEQLNRFKLPMKTLEIALIFRGPK